MNDHQTAPAAGQEQATLPPRQPHHRWQGAPRLVRWLAEWLAPSRPCPPIASAGAAEQAKEGAQGLEPSAPNISKEPPVYEGAARPRRAHQVADGAVRLECTGEPVQVFFLVNGPDGLIVRAPMGVHVLERAALRLDERTGNLDVILDLARAAEDEPAQARALND